MATQAEESTTSIVGQPAFVKKQVVELFWELDVCEPPTAVLSDGKCSFDESSTLLLTPLTFRALQSQPPFAEGFGHHLGHGGSCGSR